MPHATASVRRAAPADADAITRVHIATWRTAYRGIVPDAFLDTIPFDEWVARRRDSLTDPERHTFVAERDGEIVGLASSGPSRDAAGAFAGELYAIYVLRDHARAGVGRALFDATCEAMIAAGRPSLHLWVLHDNPSREFYVRLAGVGGESRNIEIGGASLREDSFRWPDLANRPDRPRRDVGAPKPFAFYDKRQYPTLDVASGYAAWAPSYDEIDDRLDVDLLEASALLRHEVSGSRVVDLGCGTGRIGAWLATHGAREIVGVDLTAQMLARATARRVYSTTTCANVTATGLDAGAFDGAISSLVVDHVEDLAAFFREAARLVRPLGWLAVVDFHPFFLMMGIPTHFPHGDAGGQLAVENHVHALRDFFAMAAANGWEPREFDERFVTDEWARAMPGYAKFVGRPVAHAWVYRRASGTQ